MKIVLTNDFHNTSVSLIAKEGSIGPKLSKNQIKRARKTLCGMARCWCGGPAGERGGNYRVITCADGSGYVLSRA